jgi:hypothetical protein
MFGGGSITADSLSTFDLARDESKYDSMSTLDAKMLRTLSHLTLATTASDRNSEKRSISSGSDDGMSMSPDGMEDLYLISFTRCPREFRAGLLEGPQLQDCRESMSLAGLSTELETGTKIFCKPGLYGAARKAIQRFEESLRPYHVIVTEEFRPLVLQIVKAFPRALKVKCKEEAVVARVGHSDEWVPLSVEAPLNECNEAETKDTQKDECTTAKKGKAKNAKGKNSPKGVHAASEEKDAIGALPDQSMPLDSFLPSFNPVPMVDPAFAFPTLTPPLPAQLETDPAFVQFVQAMEQQQAVFNHAVMLNMHAQRILQDNLLFAAELDHQLKA